LTTDDKILENFGNFSPINYTVKVVAQWSHEARFYNVELIKMEPFW